MAVSLNSNNPAAFTVPSSVNIAAGASSANVTVTAVAAGTATITASATTAPNVQSAAANLTFTAVNASPDIILPTGITMLPGDQLRISITLAAPAPSGGVYVTLSSSDTSKFTVSPTTVLIGSGNTTSPVQPQLTAVSLGSATLNASASGLKPASVTVRIGSSSGFTPTSVIIGTLGTTQNLTLSLASPAPAGGVTINLSSTTPAVATVPGTVKFAAGVSTVNVPVTSVSAGSTTIHASGPGLPDTTASVTVATSSGISLAANQVVPLGVSQAFPVTLGSPAPAGGVTVTLSSSNPTSIGIAPTTVNIAAGATTPTVQPKITGYNIGPSTITASAPGYTSASQVAKATATVTWSPTSIVVASGSSQRVTLALSSSAPPGTTTQGRCENPDPTTCSVTVQLSSDNPAVAQVQSSISFFPDGSSQAIDQLPITAIGPGTTIIHAGNPPYIPDATITVTVTGPGGGQPPVANAGANQTVAIGATVQLSGSGTDPQSLPLTYQWVLASKPTGSTATLSNATIPNPTFVADKFGTYSAQLTVNDGSLSSLVSTATITTQRPKPTANAGVNQTVSVGSLVTLNGSASSAVDTAPLTYAWTLTARPTGSGAALANATTASPTFTADLTGNYTAQLIVNDGFQSSNPATVIITAGAAPATLISASAGTPQSALVNQPFCAPLSALVTDSNKNPLSGVTVTFTAPSNGAGGTFATGGVTATGVTNTSGIAVSPVFTANANTGGYSVSASAQGVTTPATFSLTNTTGAPLSISSTSGTPQSATVNTAFSSLVATVQSNGCGPTVSGVSVTFQAPTSGPGGTFPGGALSATVQTNNSGVATSPVFTANALAGGYNVTASLSGGTPSTNFALTNTASQGTGGISLGVVNVGNNLQAIGTITLAKPAPAGGITVGLTSGDATKLLISSRSGVVGQGSLTSANNRRSRFPRAAALRRSICKGWLRAEP